MIFLNLLSDTGAEVFAALFIVLLGWVFGRWQGYQRWSNKTFLDRVVLSLNTIAPIVNSAGEKKFTLKLRTVFEKDIRQCFLNEQALRLVREGAAKTAQGLPVILLQKEDAWFILNYILNEISEKFADGLLRADMGLPVTAKRYIFCLTCEREGGLRVQKIRVMLLQKETLLNFPMDGEIELERAHHDIRVKTLRYMKELYGKEPHHFLELELCF